MNKPTPEDIDELTPMKRHGQSVTLPGWAWRMHTVTMAFLMSVVLIGVGIGMWDYLHTRTLVTQHEQERNEIKLAKAQASIQAAEKLAQHDLMLARHDAVMERMASALEDIRRDIAVIKSRMPP